jgi:hypothetical protein
MRVILHPLWLPYQLQSIKAVELERRERLDAQAAKIDLFASQSKVVQVLLRCGDPHGISSASLSFVLRLKKNRRRIVRV